jgi:hypothetical protein
VLAILGAVVIVWLFRDKRDANATAAADRRRAEDAERALERHLLLTNGAVLVNGSYYGPSMAALQPARRDMPVLESDTEAIR